jgi:hypothetical protein
MSIVIFVHPLNGVWPILSGIADKANAIAGGRGVILGWARTGGAMRKIPVWKTIAQGYSFTFGQLGTIIGLIWVPMVIVAVAGYFVMSQYYSAIPAALEQGDSAAAGRSLLIVILWSVVSLLLSSIMYASVTRQALGLRHGPALISFQFGAAELRVFGAVVALAAILLFFLSLYLFAAGLAAGLGQQAGSAAANARVGLTALIFLPMLFYAMVRLSFLLIPATVAEGTIALQRSWQLTRGNFWRIVLIGIVTLTPLLIVTGMAEIAILGPAFFAPHNVPAGDTDAQLRDLIQQMRAASPHMPLLYGFSFLIAPLAIGLGLAPPAFAYLALKEGAATN